MNFYKLSILTFLLILATSCKKEWEAPEETPPTQDIENIFTIKKVKNYKKAETPFDTIRPSFKEPYYINATVVANDEHGNLKGTLVLQDETGGIELRLAGTGLYTDYPIGQEVFVNLHKIVIGKNNEMLQIGWSDLLGNMYGIAPIYFDFNVKKSGFPKTPTYLTNNEIDFDRTNIKNESLGRLVKLEKCQFDEESWGQPLSYDAAPTLHKFKVNINGTEEVLYLSTSNTATFRNKEVPTTEGAIFGILRRYNSDFHLVLRSEKDMQFTDFK